jgi:hypothetical protein
MLNINYFSAYEYFVKYSPHRKLLQEKDIDLNEPYILSYVPNFDTMSHFFLKKLSSI